MNGQSGASPRRISGIAMGKLILVFAALIVVIVIGGGGFLMLWDIPAPTAHIEKVIPDARFPR
jgi:hypothetical protein